MRIGTRMAVMEHCSAAAIGTAAGGTSKTQDEIGIDLSRHNPKSFDDLEDSYFDLVIPLSPEAQHKAVEMTRVIACEVEFWNTFDPSIIESDDRETLLDAYRTVRDQLLVQLKKRFTLVTVADT